MTKPKVGELALITRYWDGDKDDPWYIGVIDEIDENGYYVCNAGLYTKVYRYGIKVTEEFREWVYKYFTVYYDKLEDVWYECYDGLPTFSMYIAHDLFESISDYRDIKANPSLAPENGTIIYNGEADDFFIFHNFKWRTLEDMLISELEHYTESGVTAEILIDLLGKLEIEYWTRGASVQVPRNKLTTRIAELYVGEVSTFTKYFANAKHDTRCLEFEGVF